jgi:hypothetical protein
VAGCAACAARCVEQRAVEENQVRKAGRNEFVWIGAKDFPDVVVKEYEMSRGDRDGTEVVPDVAKGFDRCRVIWLTRGSCLLAVQVWIDLPFCWTDD